MNQKIIGIFISMLFIGVGVSSALSIDNKSNIYNVERVEDCGCNKVSDVDLINIEKLLDKVEFFSKLSLMLGRNIPELLDNYKEIFNMISTFKTLDLKEVICNKLINILAYVLDRFSYCCQQIENFTKENRIFKVIIYTVLGNMYNALIYIINNFALKLGCENPYFP